MRPHTFNNKNLLWEPIKRKWTILLTLLPWLLIIFVIWVVIPKDTNTLYEDNLMVITNKEVFTKERLIQKLIDLNVNFPYIIYAQAELESGNFKSIMFIENNNLFGLKEAKQRPTTSKGTRNNHAYYDTWEESVLDYTLYQSSYLRGLKTEEQYLNYLGKNYAEDIKYIQKIKTIMTLNRPKSKIEILMDNLR